jgi:hypothetical protein
MDIETGGILISKLVDKVPKNKLPAMNAKEVL